MSSRFHFEAIDKHGNTELALGVLADDKDSAIAEGLQHVTTEPHGIRCNAEPENRFATEFGDGAGFVCDGDTIGAEIDGFDIEARIVLDPDSHIDDDDVHNAALASSEAERVKIERNRDLWRRDEWFFCGIVLSVSKRGILLNDHAASLWRIEANYPGWCDEPRGYGEEHDNSYLTFVANELLDEAIDAGRAALELLCDSADS